MGFNYGYEKKKFDSRWKRLEVEYCDAGMSEERREDGQPQEVMNRTVPSDPRQPDTRKWHFRAR